MSWICGAARCAAVWMHAVGACVCPVSGHGRRATRVPPVVLLFGVQAACAFGQAAPRQPNELGFIPVVMYHAIGGPAARRGKGPYDLAGLNISPQTFRRHLTMMRDAGWYPMNLRDILDPRMRVPAGKTPVVLTFDDGRPSQFRFLQDGSVDPDCAVGILERFHREHTDWPLRGTFYIMPSGPVPFGSERQAAAKLRYLLERGFEIGNHSTTHRMFAGLSAEGIRKEVAGCVKWVRTVAPAATMDTLALPGGSVPRNAEAMQAAVRGEWQGVRYENRAVVRAWGGPTLPPAHRRFSSTAVTRIGVEPGHLESWIARMRPGTPDAPYVSDGDPDCVTVPESWLPRLDRNRTAGLRIATWRDKEAGKPSDTAVTTAKPKAKDRSGARQGRRTASQKR